MNMSGLYSNAASQSRALAVVVLMMVWKPSLSSLHAINGIVYRDSKSFPQSHGSHSADFQRTHEISSIRGGGDGRSVNSIMKDHDDDEYLDNFELEKMHQQSKTMEPNFGGIVSGLFGNLRIPASLIAGAALGSAFGLPLKESDGLILGLVKRIYVVLMLGSLCSMLLTVLISTLSMNDIALSPEPRMSTSARDYIERYCLLEWILTRTNFLWGSVVFVIGSMLRGWVFLSCPLVGRGLLGIMGSFLLVSVSVVLQFCKQQTNRTPIQLMKTSAEVVRNKMKNDYVFATGIVLWIFTLLYLIVTIPHLAQYLLASDNAGWFGRRR